jgi:trk system potassium uptake protein TrkA
VNILILGVGEIGYYLAEQLSGQDHNICIIEADEKVAAEANDKLDARVVEGNGALVSVLEDAGVAEADVFLGLSSSDNTNLVAASLARSLGAKKTIARVHSDVQKDQWLFDFRSHFQVDYLFSSERLAAVELAKYIRNPDCLMVEEVARGRIELQQTKIAPGSRAAGHTLRELRLPPRVRVGSLERDGRSHIPGADDRLHAGDVVTLFGATNVLQEVAPHFQKAGQGADEVRVVIFGGGEYGLALAQMLEGGRFRTRIFERDPRRCEYLNSILRNTTLINADATSVRQLKEEQVGEADFFVAATVDDEDNVMTCLQAKDLGVKHCLTLIHRADYADAITRAGARLGILGAISPRVATSRDLMRFITPESYNVITSLRGGIDVIEFVLRENNPLVGRTVAQIDWPKGSGLIALSRGSSASVPSAEDVLEKGDAVVAMVARDTRAAFSELVGG